MQNMASEADAQSVAGNEIGNIEAEAKTEEKKYIRFEYDFYGNKDFVFETRNKRVRFCLESENQNKIDEIIKLKINGEIHEAVTSELNYLFSQFVEENENLKINFFKFKLDEQKHSMYILLPNIDFMSQVRIREMIWFFEANNIYGYFQKNMGGSDGIFEVGAEKVFFLYAKMIANKYIREHAKQKAKILLRKRFD